MSTERFQEQQSKDILQLSPQEIGNRLSALRQSHIFDTKIPGCILIEEDATCKAIAEYLSVGDLAKALIFFDRNQVDPEVEKEFNGVGGRRAFRKILEEMHVPVPDFSDASK